MLRRLILLLPFLTSPVLWAQDGRDEVVLKSGRVLAGTLGEAVPGRVVIVDYEIGEIAVPHTRVRAVLPMGKTPDIYDVVFRRNPQEEPLTPTAFVGHRRPTKEMPGALSTNVTRWHHGATDTTLFLVGAVHVGEAAYYSRLQQILDHTDVCLFEGVGGGKLEKSERESMDALFKLQLALKDLVGLGFQKDLMNYERDFWKNADVDFGTLRKEMKEKGVSLPSDSKFFQLLMKLALGFMQPETIKKNPELQMRLRRQTASMLASVDRVMKNMGKLGSVLIDYRNIRAMEVLEKELAGDRGRWISLFYGAAHLSDFCERLRKTGWVCQGEDHVDAWTLER